MVAMAEPLIATVFSGGQTGVDRAALDAAITAGIEYGGWSPLGGWAEDFTSPPGLLAAYPLLHEAPSPDPALRTRLNVRDSDATLVVRRPSVASPGTDLTVALANALGRPVLVTAGDVEAVMAWLAGLGTGLTLNIAGPRESHDPGIYQVTRLLVDELLRRCA